MVFQQQRARFVEASGAVFGEQSLEIGAAADVLGRFLPIGLRQARPHAGGGGLHHRGVGGFLANLRHGSLQGWIHGTDFGGHATPPT